MPKNWSARNTSLASKFKKRYGNNGRKKSYTAKLLDSKINTAAEVAAKRIAQEEIARAQVSLVYRCYLWGGYAMDTNIHSFGTRVDWDGLVTPIAAIQLIDSDARVKILPATNSALTPSEWIDPGVNVVAMRHKMDGFRQAYRIKVMSLKVGFRFWLPALSADDLESPFEGAHVHWRICSVNYDGMDALASTPTPESLLPMQRFGFQRRLDVPPESADPVRYNLRIHKEGHATLRQRPLGAAPDVKFVSAYASLRQNPLTIEYEPEDQNGQRVVRNKLFLVIRSDVPPGAGFVPFQPIVNAFTKVHYVDT